MGGGPKEFPVRAAVYLREHNGEMKDSSLLYFVPGWYKFCQKCDKGCVYFSFGVWVVDEFTDSHIYQKWKSEGTIKAMFTF